MHHLTTIPVLFLSMATGLHADDPLQPLVDSIRGAEPFVVQETVVGNRA